MRQALHSKESHEHIANRATKVLAPLGISEIFSNPISPVNVTAYSTPLTDPKKLVLDYGFQAEKALEFSEKYKQGLNDKIALGVIGVTFCQELLHGVPKDKRSSPEIELT